MKKLVRISISSFRYAIFYLLYLIFFPTPAWAQPCYSGGVGTIGCLQYYVQGIINFIFPIAVAIALFFLMWGGIGFVRSGGDPKKVEQAKKTLTYSLGGLAVIFLAWFISWVIQQATGVNITQYNIVVP